MSTQRILEQVISELPESVASGTLAELGRFVFEVDLVRDRVAPGATVCDVGAGWGVFLLAISAAGMKSILIDDFLESGFHDPVAVAVRRAWDRRDIEVVKRDLTHEPFDFAPQSLDAVTSFGCIEHWHASPKRMLHDAMRALKPGGLMVIGTPNSANLRKRLTALAGGTSWSAMDDWYEKETFRGHVREPNVHDLLYIGRDIGLQRMKVFGRNFAGTVPGRPLWIRTLTPLVDRLLRARPNLSANIYLVGYKPEATGEPEVRELDGGAQ